MNHTIEPELTLDWGNRLLEGTNRTLCLRTQEKGAVTPQETDSDSPSSVQQTCGLVVACFGGERGLRVAVLAGELLKEVAIIFINSTIVWPQVK